MKRAAIYARYSSDLQNDRSIDDQFMICRRYAASHDLEIVNEYSDWARSGASIIGRDGLAALMRDAEGGAFDIVLVEALDRLSRDQEDLAHLYKRLSFLGIAIQSIHDGRADHIQIGVKGLLGSLFLQDLANKVRRGLDGRVAAGKLPGGRSYGYRPVPGMPGDAEIKEDEAVVIRRIYRDFVGGKSARTICIELNAEGVPPPRGSIWRASTLIGSASRGYGLLRNELFRGRIVWNRVRMLKNHQRASAFPAKTQRASGDFMMPRICASYRTSCLWPHRNASGRCIRAKRA